MSLACYFDCDGTLVGYDGAYAALFADACARSGLDDDVDHDVTPAREAGFRTVHVDATLAGRAVAVGSVGALGRLADLF